MINPDIHMAVTKTARDLADTLDQKILDFFGSEEQLKAYAHLFVIEHLPTGISTVPSEIGNQFIFHVETEIRIRPKTMAELEAEKNV
jgi:hypothetical protein